MADAKLYSNLYGSVIILPHPDLSYATLQASLAGAANAADYKEALLRVRDSSPCVLALVDRDHPAMIVIAHAPRVFRAVPGSVHPSDGLVIALLGNDPTTLGYAVLPDTAFASTGLMPICDDVGAHHTELLTRIAAGETHVRTANNDANTTRRPTGSVNKCIDRRLRGSVAKNVTLS